MFRIDEVRMKRLAKFIDGFATAFMREAPCEVPQRYVQGLLSDAKRKNMEGMLRRLSDPCHYQRLQHFITHSTWAAEAVWKQLREWVPERSGFLLVDDTGIPKQGTESAGVARQYCGALGKVANCQVVVTTALRTERAVWPLAMELYLSEEWCEDEDRRERVRVPESQVHRTKIEMALQQVDLARAAGFEITCVLADAGYGDATDFREGIASRGLKYAVGVARTTRVFVNTPRFVVPTRAGPLGRPRSRKQLASGSPRPVSLEQIAANAPASAWRRITWRRGTKGPLRADFLLLRVTPAHRWQDGRQHDEVWLVCERTLGKDSIRKYYFSSLPPDLPAKRLIAIIHERWAIEAQYRDLKQETALDHFEGRSFPGLHRHLVLTALAYTFLQHERCRATGNLPSITAFRESITEVIVVLLFASGEEFAKRTARYIRNRDP